MMTRTRDGSRETVARVRGARAPPARTEQKKSRRFARCSWARSRGGTRTPRRPRTTRWRRNGAPTRVPAGFLRETRARERGAPCGPRRLPRRKTVVATLLLFHSVEYLDYRSSLFVPNMFVPNPKTAPLIKSAKVGARQHFRSRGERASLTFRSARGILVETLRVPSRIARASHIQLPGLCGSHLISQVRTPLPLILCRQSPICLRRPDRPGLCGVVPGGKSRVRPRRARDSADDSPLATSPRAQRPPRRSASWVDVA